jgi:sporulation protein YlmC with PRC-barrel domain
MVFIATVALVVLFVILAWVVSRRSDRRLARFKELKGYAVHGRDGQIGNVDDVYFGDDDWKIQYLVVDTSIWIFGKKVLISPHAVRRVDIQQEKVFLNLTKSQVESSPELRHELPLLREDEAVYNEYYQWPFYWSVGTMSFTVSAELYGPRGAGPVEEPPIPAEMQGPIAEPSLRSMAHLMGYSFRSRGGDVGRVDDALIDGRNWRVLYLVVDTNALLPGGKALVAPEWLEKVEWPETTVRADLEREAIESAPTFDLNRRLTRRYESRLFRHYGRNGGSSSAPPAARRQQR